MGVAVHVIKTDQKPKTLHLEKKKQVADQIDFDNLKIL